MGGPELLEVGDGEFVHILVVNPAEILELAVVQDEGKLHGHAGGKEGLRCWVMLRLAKAALWFMV